MFGINFFSPEFATALLSVIMIDLVLAGDNAVVIAMAVQSLPKKKKMQGIIFGALAAIVLRVVFTFFASQLLVISFVKLIGGAAILWIAVKLITSSGGEECKGKSATTVWSAVWTILIADVTMSIDNILAVAGASHGSLPLLLFGLGLSIPLVVFASSVISKSMERFPLIMWVGALILGKVGGEMMVTDPFMVSQIFSRFGLVEAKGTAIITQHPVVWIAELTAALGVLGISLLIRSHNNRRRIAVPTQDTQAVLEQ